MDECAGGGWLRSLRSQGKRVCLKMPDKSCSNCIHSSQWGRALRCRRYPPIIDASPENRWPKVEFNDICGEFTEFLPSTPKADDDAK